ncbi:MAG TPA: 23S rRNA (uracil(1939)-C(5))-methyltransferase RlmD, partial [Candidatus Aminicenantes bacterium]|nr:23S rRNA (uracil(1939)-C(5))-methyltransferase RlmD [Candidatus Aminicenantes bacterium]
MRIRVDKIVYPGRRLGLAGGKVVFTDAGLPGETVEVEVVRDRRSYAEARTVAVVEPSPRRVAPRCGHYLACSPYQDMDDGLELEVKRGQVAEIMGRELRRPCGPPPVTASPESWGYRNRIRLRVRWSEAGRAELVYHEPGERASFVPVDRCYLVPERVNGLLARLRETIEAGPFRSVEAIEVRTSRTRGDSLVALDLASEAEKAALGEALAGARKELALAGAVASVFDGKRRRDERLFGRDFLEETVGGRTFRAGARSFFQANVGILERVFDDVAAAAAARAGETVADLYCGVGTFGIPLAARAREVFGVEPDPGNIGFLKRNLALNGVGNFAVCEGTAEEWLEEILGRGPGVVVADPPRRGLAPAVVAGLVAAPVPLLLYLSCNPATLARDLKALLG